MDDFNENMDVQATETVDQVDVAENHGDVDDEHLEKARNHGWVDASKIDYNAIADAAPQWASSAAVYEWNGDEGEVGPANPFLEEKLFKDAHQPRAGDAFNALQLTVTQEGPIQVKPATSFEDAGLHPIVLENVKRCGYEKTTAVQAYCIPAVLTGRDIVAVAQTGSGKTAAYLVPVVSKLMGRATKLRGPRPDIRAPDYDPDVHKTRAEPLVIIVCPTRELAQQIFDEARRITYRSMLRPVCCYGGVPVKMNLQELGKGCDILIATAGRLVDLMDKPHVLTMNRVKFTIIDEADEMLGDDWSDELGKIMAGGDNNEDADHIYMMFSATFPKGARTLAREYMAQDYLRIRVGRAGSTHQNVKQDIIYVDGDSKREALHDLLYASPPCRTLIFVNSIPGVENVDDYLFQRGLPTAFIHGKRSQYEREDAIRGFKTGKIPILISTNIAGRGIDIAHIGHVINYDLPQVANGGIDEYVHRIGRTGRIGHVGHATSFYSDRNEDLGPALVNILLEAEQPVPDFLEQFKPEDGKPDFDDNSDDDEEEEAGEDATGDGVAAGGAWGTEGDAPVSAEGGDWGAPAEAPAVSDDAWGQPAPAAVSAW